MTWEDLLVDGDSMSDLGYRIITDFDGAYTSADESGEPEEIAGRDGAEDVPHDFRPVVVALGIQLRGGTLTGYNDLRRALTRLVKPGQLTTLERRLSYTTGDESHTCRARYLSGLPPTKPTPSIGRHTMQWLNLDGVWYGPQESVTSGNGRTIKGDTRTRRITLIFPGPGTLTNSVTGAFITVTSGAPTVDVEHQTSTESLANLSAGGNSDGNWFDLMPGLQNLVWTGSGSVTIEYEPAYP